MSDSISNLSMAPNPPPSTVIDRQELLTEIGRLKKELEYEVFRLQDRLRTIESDIRVIQNTLGNLYGKDYRSNKPRK